MSSLKRAVLIILLLDEDNIVVSQVVFRRQNMRLLVRSAFVGCIAFLACMMGCGNQERAERENFSREYDLAIRAGKGLISEEEKLKLFREDHAVLHLLGGRSKHYLLELFANLPSDQHADLRRNSFVKWKYRELDPHRQQLLTDSAARSVDELSSGRCLVEVQEMKKRLLEEIQECELGYTILKHPNSEPFVSFFAFHTTGELNHCVIIANYKAVDWTIAGALMEDRISMLRTMRCTPVPSDT